MKKTFKAVIVSILVWQVRRLQEKNKFKIIAVVGSIGKTSTKLAISQVLSESKQVQYQEGNYNDIVSVPLIFFGQSLPSLINPFAWIRVLAKNEMVIAKKYPYEVVVVELGTDSPGQIAAFKRYICADIGIVTALTPEHMENFTDLASVADEELSIATFCKSLLINNDLCPAELVTAISGGFMTYGILKQANYQLKEIAYNIAGSTFTIYKNNAVLTLANHSSYSVPQLYSLTAAVAVGEMLEIDLSNIIDGFKNIKPVAGRMQILNGIKNSKIIDDTYNASPDATLAALTTLYRMPATQKIALLGNMNELGSFSVVAHTDIGRYCDPERLDIVVTLGEDANHYLADAAEKNGCKVVRASTPFEAGNIIADLLREGGLVLAKGSQNGVYAEEAIKALLADPTDENKLVRQSPTWLKTKNSRFGKKEKKK